MAIWANENVSGCFFAEHSVYSFVHDAQRSAVISSRRCDLSPERSARCQLQSISHRYSQLVWDVDIGHASSRLMTRHS